MENYIVINGKKAELTKEQLEKLGIKTEKNKYEEMFHRELHEYYYFIRAYGNLGDNSEEYDSLDDKYYYIGNYCKDEAIMKQRALHETLNRLLWRASVIAGELDKGWKNNLANFHYYIYYDNDSDSLKIGYNCACQSQGTCYFPTVESANDALENIVNPFMKEHPDFVW